ncbi:MAG TPA: sensor histidine kinase KdpD [Trichormus sp.]|jgi:two-component system sensor histidine kinase KdpD
MEASRPDPEEILAKLKRSQQLAVSGKLKIFLGATAGVGKTYTMLEEAQKLKKEGTDVVAGCVVTHKRVETEKLLQGLEEIPEVEMEYKGTNLFEFDIDAALVRKPGLILIDELAHTNAPGSRHEKRWQDVKELLGAGINVYSTLNVQHLESANDLVRQVTGITVRETVPDSFFEDAYEVELVDLPPDDLIQRLKEGKIYLPEYGKTALENFFRKPNLVALRELALRSLAERIDTQVQEYRREEAVADVWALADKMLVCVGPSPLSQRLVRATKRMATRQHADWIAVFVDTPKMTRLPQRDRNRVAKTLELAERLGGETTTIPGTDASEELVSYARRHNITKIVIGKPARPRWREIIFGSLVDDLIRKSGDIDVYVITGDRQQQDVAPTQYRPKPINWRGYAFAVAMVALATVLVKIFAHTLAEANLVMVYQLAVVLTAIKYGRGPSILSALISVMAFDFFFIPPYFSFAVSDTQYLITFTVMLVIGLLLSTLTSTIRAQAYSARQREDRTAALYALSREQATAMTKEQVIEKSVKHIAKVFDAKVSVFMEEDLGKLHQIQDSTTASFEADAKETGVAQWVFINGLPAGKGTSTLPGSRAMYLPLSTVGGRIGVIGLLASVPDRVFEPEEMHLLEMFTNQMALAVERAVLSKEAAKSPVAATQTDSEKTT